MFLMQKATTSLLQRLLAACCLHGQQCNKVLSAFHADKPMALEVMIELCVWVGFRAALRASLSLAYRTSAPCSHPLCRMNVDSFPALFVPALRHQHQHNRRLPGPAQLPTTA